MVNVGIIGLGIMGMTHLDSYLKLENVNISAVSDKNPDLLSGKIQATGNIDRQCEGGFVFTQVHNIQSNVPSENIIVAYRIAFEY